VFKVFGEVSEVTVEPTQGYALVQFRDIVAAFMAQQSLNNFYLSKYNASLSVKWVIKKESDEAAD
jgi:RNA recognition motif. (a.k.a. RRM, RBD, or RNP domain)